MGRYVLFPKAENRFVTNAELIASMSIPSRDPCGFVNTDGIEGDRDRVKIDALDETARFYDHQSALNAIRHDGNDVPGEGLELRTLCCEGCG